MQDKKDIPLIVARNIRNRRTELNMTQDELAHSIGYSNKSVSKWESGTGPPPTVILPKLAQVLQTNIDTLLSDKSDKMLFLGINGEGSKTEFALADSSGKIIKTVYLGTSDPNNIGIDASLEVLKRGIIEICGDLPKRNISLFAGLAGGSAYGQIHEFLSQFGFARASNGSDAMNALSAGLGNYDGIVVIIGAGSSTFAQVNGKIHRVGGYGYLFDDVGSGFALGREAIHSALCFEDGSGDETILYNMVKNMCGTECVLDSIDRFYKEGKSLIVKYAPLVFEAYKNGDRIAEKILHDNFEALAQNIRRAARYLPCEKDNVNVVLCGELCTKGDIIVTLLRKILSDCDNNYTVSICERPMIYGALRLAGTMQD